MSAKAKKATKNVVTISNNLFDEYMQALQLDVIHAQANFDNMIFDAYKLNELANLMIEAKAEDFQRKLATYSNRERNNLVRQRTHENATKFSKCVKVESQSYKIEKSLEQFKTIKEHAEYAHVDAKRVARHMKFLDKEQAKTCKLVVDASNKSRFKYVNID